MVLSLLLMMGFIALDNTRYLSATLKWQAYSYNKRVHLNWQLESVINCLAIHLASVQALSIDQCDTDVHISIHAHQSTNQFKIEVDRDSIASSAIMQLGEMEYNAAIVSNHLLPEGVLDPNAIIESSVMTVFYGYAKIDSLKQRWSHQLFVSSIDACADEILQQVELGIHDLLIRGDCSIDTYHWDQLAQWSTIYPLYFLFEGKNLKFSGSKILHGVIAIWQDDDNKSAVIISGSPQIEGGLLLQVSVPLLIEQGSLQVIENADYLTASRFKFAKRSWVSGGWRDF